MLVVLVKEGVEVGRVAGELAEGGGGMEESEEREGGKGKGEGSKGREG